MFVTTLLQIKEFPIYTVTGKVKYLFPILILKKKIQLPINDFKNQCTHLNVCTCQRDPFLFLTASVFLDKA